MMTTKVFQRVLATFLVVAAIFLANGLTNVANAARVQIYDGNVNDFFNNIKEMSSLLKEYGGEYANVNLAIRGTHYWNDKNGFRYCESRFGDSDKHRLIFQVNNNGAVSSAWIIFPGDMMSGERNRSGAEISGGLLASTFITIGLSENEFKNIMDSFMTWNENNRRKNIEVEQALNKNDIKSAKQKQNEIEHNKTFSVWCVKSKRYIDLNCSTSYANENDMSGIYTILISAHI